MTTNTPAPAQEAVLTDEQIEALAKKHICPHHDRLEAILPNRVPYQQTEQFRRVKALIVDVLSKLRARVADEQDRTAISQFLTDVMTAAGLVAHGKRCKALAERLGEACMKLRLPAALASAPVAGEAAYYAVMHGQALYGIFDSEAAAVVIAKARGAQ